MKHEEENMFEETVAHVYHDDEFDPAPAIALSATYQINFGKTNLRLMSDKTILAEIPYTNLKNPDVRTSHKDVCEMMDDFKKHGVDKWMLKYLK